MISNLIVISNHVHYNAFDNVNISKVFKNLFLYLLVDDVILLTELVPDFNCK